MPLTIYPPKGFSFIGERAVNQDAVAPKLAEATEHDRLFMVCDGMGGGPSGEIASQLVIQGVTEFFNSYEFPFGKHPIGSGNDVSASLETQFINDAVKDVQIQMDDYLTTHPTVKGMGSTLALLYLVHQQHVSSALIAHIGDSRIYQVRNGKILWQTQDHKWVNEMVKKGVITPEEAETHPKRNIITRVVQAASERADVADIQELFDLQPDDYFFLCSDGVLEALTDAQLEEILGSSTSEDEKLAQLKSVCEGNTSDNASAYLIKIKTAELVKAESEDIVGTEIKENEPTAQEESAVSESKFNTPRTLIVLLLLILGGWLIYDKLLKKPTNQSELKVIGTTSKVITVPKTKPHER